MEGDGSKNALIEQLKATQGKLEAWKKALDSKEPDATATASALGGEVLKGLQDSSELFKLYIAKEKAAVPAAESPAARVPAPESAHLLSSLSDDGREYDAALGKMLDEEFGTGSSGGRRKKTTRKLRGGQQATEVKEFGAPNNNLIYNAAGLITDARNPVTVGLTGTERLIDTHAPFSTGMDTGAFSGTDNLPPTITSQITPVLGYSGGAKSKKRVTKRK